MAQILNNTYEILGFVGKGGMSTVFKARHIRLDSVVAVKSVRKDQPFDLQAEVSILKKLNHPNLVRVLDVFEDDRLIYIVMDYIEGEDLQHVIKREKRIPEGKVREWFITLAEVLSYLHSRVPPVIYRDMKPANIILQKDGNLKLVDFGIAREYKANASGDTTYIGTTGFAAPEQFGIAQSDSRTDIYSLGMTMYYLVTGKSPNEPPYTYVPARKLVPEISEDLEKILEKCTRYKPGERYRDAEELLNDLRGETVTDERSGPAAEQDEYSQKRSGEKKEDTGSTVSRPVKKRKFPFGFFIFIAAAIAAAPVLKSMGGINIDLTRPVFEESKEVPQNTKEFDYDRVKEGITVFHEMYGEGKVSYIEKDKYVIEVEFKNGKQRFSFPQVFERGNLKVISYDVGDPENGE